MKHSFTRIAQLFLFFALLSSFTPLSENRDNCEDAVIETVSKSGDACQPGMPITLVVTGELNDATDWHWYADDCGQTPVGVGDSIVVTPQITTAYYVRGEPDCDGFMPCVSIEVVVETDVTPPTVSCPANQLAASAGACSITLADYTDLASASDDCDDSPVLSQSPAEGAPVSGSALVTIYATDASENVDSCSFTVTVQAQTLAFSSMPGDTTVSCAAAVPGDPGVTAEDECGGAIAVVFTQTGLPLSCAGQGTVLNTWTATDSLGHEISHTQTVTVANTAAPVFSSQPADVTVACEDDVPGDQGITATDGCGFAATVVFTQTGLPASYPNPGPVHNTWTATDCAGNSSVYTQIVTLQDVTPPSVSCPANQLVASAGACSITLADYTDLATASDDCDDSPVLSQSPAEGAPVSGSALVTIYATDASENVDSCSFTVTVQAQTLAFSSMPGDTTVSCAAAVPGDPGVTAEDECGGAIAVVFTQTGLPLSCAGQGTVLNTWTATDSLGHEISHTQTVTVANTAAPVFSSQPADVTVACEDDVPGDQGITATDGCGFAATVVFTQTGLPASYPNPGPVHNTWTATDCAGNSSVYTQIVTLLDVTAPSVSCPANQIVASAGACSITLADYTDLATASDDCDDSPVLSQSPAEGAPVSGSALVTIYATDASENVDSCSFTVTVQAQTLAFSSMPGDTTVSCAAAVPGDPGVTAQDECGGAIAVVFTQTGLPLSCAGQGTVLNTWTATDSLGHEISHTQTVTVANTAAPVFSSQPADVTVACEDDVPGDQGITATDGCGFAATVVFAQTGFPVPYPNPGAIQNTWTATDCAGNSSVYTQTVTVEDTTPPVALCKNITITLDAGGEAVISPSDVDDNSSDNCEIESYALSKTLFTCPDVGLRSVTLTVTDLFDNSASCTALVSVIASAACPAPDIAFDGGPNISDPCVCMGNGLFQEEVVIGPTGSGQIWMVTATTLLNPNTMAPYNPGTQFIEHPLGGGVSIYTLSGIHADGTGYSITAASPFFPGQNLNISNVCYYPQPQILGLDGPFCIYSDPVTLEGDVGGVALVSEAFTIDGAPATVFDPFSLGVGNYQVVYTVDAGPAAPGDPSDPGCVASATQWVQVLQTPSSMACNNLVTVAVDANCEALITPDMILEGTYPCYDDYSVTVRYQINTLPNPVPGSYIGLTLTATVKHLPSGNSCSGSLILTDGLPPVFTCPTQPAQVACSANVNAVPPPVAVDNCTAVTVQMIDEFFVDTEVCDDNKVVLHRIWRAVDAYGNQSAPCLQVIEIVRPTDVDFPNDIIWSCNQYNNHPSILFASSLHPSILALQSGIDPIDATGITSTSVLNNTGSGKPEGLDGTYCAYSYSFSDQTLNGCGTSFTIVRTWTVLDWCSGLVITQNAAGEDNVQIINVIDATPPVVTRAPFSVSANIPGNSQQPCTSQGFLPPATVSDNCNTWILRIYTPVGEAIYLNGQNGSQGGFIPPPGLSIGVHTVVYQATDACNNITEFPVQVTVVDDIAPVAICDQITQVSLSSNGLAVVNASVFDDGSYDNCCLDFFQVRRMTDACGIPSNTNFGPNVTFCCADVGPDPVQVVLRVYDCFDNYNECMVQVMVEDKLPPFVVTCPSNQTITCEFYQDELAAALAQGNYGVLDQFGEPFFYDNCSVSVSQNVTVNIDNCSQGTIVRTWTAVDPFGNPPATCTQTITVQHVSNWAIQFPANITATCDSGQLPPFGYPEVFFDDCELVGISYSDQTFNSPSGACYMIVRTWTAVNWCIYTGANPFTELTEIQANQDFNGDGIKNNRTFKDGVNNGSGPDGYITYSQIITVVDEEAPVFDVEDLEVCIEGTQCNTTVNLLVPLVEDCSNNIDIQITTNLPNGAGFGPYLNVPPGTYSAQYAVSDGCNNTSFDQITITVTDCKKPTPICKNGLVAEIMQTGMIGITAEMLDDSSFDNCSGDLLFSFSSDVNDTLRVFTCDDLGVQPVNVWVTDASGNQDFCATFVIIQDNMGACNTLIIAGHVEQSNGSPVANVMVDINGGQESMLTNYAGAYDFLLQGANDYTVTPSLDVFPVNGVTTLDMTLIQQHILGVWLLNSPYKIIAADANNSGAVTTLDLVVIQKVILSIIPAFPGNTSWRFVDKDFVFPNPQNPWQTTFPEVISFNNLSADEIYADFVAIKVGDVNNSAIGDFLNGEVQERQFVGPVDFVTDDRILTAGERFTARFRMRPVSIMGYQFTLEFPTEAIEWEELTPGLARDDNFGWAMAGEGAITTNWFDSQPHSLDENATLFELSGIAKKDGRLSEWLRISSRVTPQEAYNGAGDFLQMRLLFEGADEKETGFALFQNQPNPFRGNTRIGFNLPEACNARLTVWDASGKILSHIEGAFHEGYNEVTLEALRASGVLYYQLETPTHTAIKKMIAVE
jgi:hypothetical protein